MSDICLKDHPFVRCLDATYFGTLDQYSVPWRIAAGDYIWRQGDEADFLLLICSGQVGLEIAVPLNAPLRIDIVAEGEILGWSWLLPPYRWHFDARALTRVCAFRIDGRALRDASERDPAFGYQLLKQFTGIIVRRLENAQRRLLNL
jgi:CRP/FNR family transcriptional regulator, cyclic AMP receptor protein